ncbi:CinA family protein [Acetobacter pasteurianus]|nr:CinA family protein [Acetobacter pasteurianus]
MPSLTMSFPPKEITEIVTEIAQILRSKNQTLAISEAACGGLISAYIVSVPGASDFYIGGKLLYSLKQRLKLSGWSQDEIANYMGPSELVARKLARTAKYELGSTFVLSETGFAGPSTDLHLDEKEKELEKELELKLKTDQLQEQESGSGSGSGSVVGTVFIGFTGPNGDCSTSKTTGSHDRAQNMSDFAKFALQFLLNQLKNENEN